MPPHVPHVPRKKPHISDVFLHRKPSEGSKDASQFADTAKTCSDPENLSASNRHLWENGTKIPTFTNFQIIASAETACFGVFPIFLSLRGNIRPCILKTTTRYLADKNYLIKTVNKTGLTCLQQLGRDILRQHDHIT